MNDDQGDGNTSDELGDFDVGGIWSEGEEYIPTISLPVAS